MNKIDKLIQEICPNGIQFKAIGDIWQRASKSKLGVKQVSELETGDNICFTSGKNSFFVKEYLVDGEYLFLNDGGSADTKYNNGKAYYTDHVIAFSIKENISILPKFLYYYLLNMEKQINENYFKGAGIKNIVVRDFIKLKIPVPPVKIQEKIIKVLDKFTELEAELELRIKEFNFWLEKTMIYDLAYTKKELKEFCLVGDGLHGTPTYNQKGAYFFINGNNLRNGQIVFTENTKRVDDAVYEKYGRKFNNDTLFMSINGTIGNLAIYKNENIVLGKSVAYFDFISKKMIPKYLYYYLQTDTAKNYFKVSSSGSTIQNLGLKALREMKIYCPPIKIQENSIRILNQLIRLVSDYSCGLPAEIELRRKQYEYYRNKLLTFKEL